MARLPVTTAAEAVLRGEGLPAAQGLADDVIRLQKELLGKSRVPQWLVLLRVPTRNQAGHTARPGSIQRLDTGHQHHIAVDQPGGRRGWLAGLARCAQGAGVRSCGRAAGMMVCRNLRKRTLHWPWMEGVTVAVAPGDTFLVHDGDLVTQAWLRDVLEALIWGRILAVVRMDAVPVLH